MLQLNDTASTGPQYAIGGGNTPPTPSRLPSRLTGLSAPIQPGSVTAPNTGTHVFNGAMAAATAPNTGTSVYGGPMAAATAPSIDVQHFNGPMVGAVGNPAAGAAQPAAPGAAMPSALPSQPAASAPIPPVSAAPQNLWYGTTSSFGPGNDLQSTQIAPGQESNRFDLANQQLQTYQNQVLPQFQHDLRTTVQNNAAMGRLGSGMLNTDVGNLDLAQQNSYNNMKSSLLNTALGNQITDNANQRNELRGERDYQTGQANNAFNQGMQQTELGDSLTNSAFGRSLQQEQAGEANNPANTSLLLSQIFGNQAGQAGQALSGLIGSTTQNNALNNNGLSQLLETIFGGGGGTPTVPQSVPDYPIPGVTG